MRPRIEAERELAMYNAVLAAGGRTMEDRDQRQYLAALRQAAEGDVEPEKRPRVRPSLAFMQEFHAAAQRAGGG